MVQRELRPLQTASSGDKFNDEGEKIEELVTVFSSDLTMCRTLT